MKTFGPNLGLLDDAGYAEAVYREITAMYRALDLFVQPHVKSVTVVNPPTDPDEGDAYIVPTGATGVWSGHVGQIARWTERPSAVEPMWEFFVPKTHWMFGVDDAVGNTHVRYNGTTWVPFSTSGGGGGDYVLPPASTTDLGGIIVGDNLTVDENGRLNGQAGGAPGADGSVWRDGNAAPSASIGVDGDYYLNTLTGDVYCKESGGYVVKGNISGPQGSQGPQGLPGTNGTNGTNGSTMRSGTGAPSNSLGVDGDYYLDTLSGGLYKRISGSYSVQGNLKGPQGPQGIQGEPGAPGATEWAGITGKPTDFPPSAHGHGLADIDFSGPDNTPQKIYDATTVILYAMTDNVNTRGGFFSSGILTLGGGAVTNTLEVGPNYLTVNGTMTADQFDLLNDTVEVSEGGTGAATATGARANLGLGALAVKGSVNNADWSGTDLSVTNGGTGASDAATALSNLGGLASDLSNITATATSVDGTETFHFIQGVTAKKGPVSKIKDWLLGLANTWGSLQTLSGGATVPTASGSGNLYSGTYTPTLTNTANLDSSTAYACQYMRVGNVVTVSGRLGLDPTTAATITTLEMTLPVGSDISTAGDIGGVFAYTSGYGQVNGSAANNKAVFTISPAGNTALSSYFTFTYQVI